MRIDARIIRIAPVELELHMCVESGGESLGGRVLPVAHLRAQSFNLRAIPLQRVLQRSEPRSRFGAHRPHRPRVPRAFAHAIFGVEALTSSTARSTRRSWRCCPRRLYVLTRCSSYKLRWPTLISCGRCRSQWRILGSRGDWDRCPRRQLSGCCSESFGKNRSSDFARPLSSLHFTEYSYQNRNPFL